MTREQFRDNIAYFAPFTGQPNPHRPAINLAPLVVHIFHFNKFLQVVAYIASLIVAAAFQLTRRDLIVTDIEQQQRLYRVDLQYAYTFKFVFDDVQKLVVKSFDQRQRFQMSGHEPLIVDCP
jgi:hypothetical protein